MSNQLPNNWAEIPLGEAVLSRKGKKPACTVDTPQSGYDPYILIHEMEGGELRAYTNDPKVPRSTEKDVLLVWDGSIGKCASGISGAIGSTIVAITPMGSIPTRFIEYFIKNKRSYILQNSTGTGLQHINKNFFKDCIFQLPPLQEQKRIVAKLDGLFAHLEEVKTRLDKIPQLLKDFRQAVLTKAVGGELTENYRNQNSLPKWKDVELKDLAEKIFDGPFGSNLKSSDYTESGALVVRLENIGEMEFKGDKKSYVSEEKFELLQKHELFENDILLASFIADEVRTTLVPKLDVKAINKADCFCIRLGDSELLKEFCLYTLSSEKTYNYLTGLAHGMTRPRINLTQLRSVNIGLPSVSEQEQIIKMVESYFNRFSLIERKYQTLLKVTENIPQAILAKAFKGELVEQLPTDGDARELLKEIEALKAEVKPKKRSKK